MTTLAPKNHKKAIQIREKSTVFGENRSSHSPASRHNLSNLGFVRNVKEHFLQILDSNKFTFPGPPTVEVRQLNVLQTESLESSMRNPGSAAKRPRKSSRTPP